MSPTASTVLMVLDVDGVLNRLPEITELEPRDFEGHELNFGEAFVNDERGRQFLIRPNLAVIGELDELSHLPEVHLCWLTTWAKAIDSVTEFAFGGKLSGGTVIANRPSGEFELIDWKATALLRYLEEHGKPPYIGADDDAVPEARLFIPEFGDEADNQPRLLLEPDPTIGLTLDDVEIIRDFIDEVQRSMHQSDNAPAN